MWQKIFDFARTLWTQGQETRKNSEEIKKLQDQNEQFSMMLLALATRDQEIGREIQYLKESLSKDMDSLSCA